MKIEVNVYSKEIVNFAKKHDDVVVLSADLGSSCEIKDFSNIFPERYFSLGIAEQNMISWAAGLARENYRPYIHTFAVFLYRRVLDQLEMSVAYPNLPVVLMGFVPGITTPGGVSHQSINDIATLRAIPNMNIIDIGDATEIESVLDITREINGPVYVRMLRKEVPRLFPANEPMIFNKARIISTGDDIVLLTSSICTEEALRATSVLKKSGISIQHMHVSTLKPFNDESIVEAIRKSKHGVITMENHLKTGGLGSAVAELIAERGLAKKLIRVGLNDTYTHGASKMYLMKKYKIDAMSMIEAVETLCNKKLNLSESDLEDLRFVDFSAV